MPTGTQGGIIKGSLFSVSVQLALFILAFFAWYRPDLAVPLLFFYLPLIICVTFAYKAYTDILRLLETLAHPAHRDELLPSQYFKQFTIAPPVAPPPTTTATNDN